MNSNKSFCPVAFREIFIDQSGRYRLCCHSREIKEFKDFREDKTLPFDYFLSEHMENIRQKMFEGKKIKECRTCYQLEEASGTSYRERHFRNYGLVDDIRNVTLKIRIFGNYCNLSCYMCHPHNSTERKKELDKVFPKSNKEDWNKFISKDLMQIASKNFKYHEWNDHMKHILDHIHLIGRFQMLGGETLLLPKFWQFLDEIPKEHAERIMVSAQSNLTKTNYKNYNLFDIVNKFKKFYLGVSVDHYKEKLSFMRYPIKPQEFEKNLYKISKDNKINFSISCTVSVLNIDDIFEIKKYYNNKFRLKNSIDFENIVRGPSYLSIRNLPSKLKTYYLQKYKEYPYIIAELKEEQNCASDKFMSYCDKLSESRNLDWRPMWKDFIKKYENNMC